MTTFFITFEHAMQSTVCTDFYDKAIALCFYSHVSNKDMLLIFFFNEVRVRTKDICRPCILYMTYGVYA